MQTLLFKQSSGSLHRILFMAIIAAPLLIMTSCQKKADGPTRYELSGLATYGGKPIPAGLVIFEPDGAKGNTGPGGIGQILEGKYRTSPDRGIVGGAHRVRVIGYLHPHVPQRPEPDLLFPEYLLHAELPQQNNASWDIDVPMSSAER